MSSWNVLKERQKEILNYIQEKRSVDTNEIAEKFDISLSTARRDLDYLGGNGLIDRTHGGAIRSDSGMAFEMLRNEKQAIMIEEKKRIAQKAVEFVKDRDTIFLDTGSTTLQVAKQLVALKHLTVITNDLEIASTVELDPTSQLILTGGMRRFEYGALVGAPADQFLKSINMNICFLGADSISHDGMITNANISEAELKKIALNNSEFRILVADHTKIGKRSLATVGFVGDMDVVIMDDVPDDGDILQIERECQRFIRV